MNIPKMIKSERSKRKKLKHELNYIFHQSPFFNNASKSEKSEEKLNSVPCKLSIDTRSLSHPTTTCKDTIESSTKAP